MVSYDYAVASAAAQSFDWNGLDDTTVEGTISFALWDCTAYTTWVDGLSTPTDLQQAIVDNYSSYALGVLLHYDEINGTTLTDGDADGDNQMKAAYNGNIWCMTEAEYDETSDSVVADDDGATLCLAANYATDTAQFGTVNLDKAAWDAATASTNGNDATVTQLYYSNGVDNSLGGTQNDGLVEAGINEFILQPMDADTFQDYFHVYKSQLRCDADLSTAAVTLAPDFRLDLGDSVIINRINGSAQNNVAGLGADRTFTLTGENACDADDFAVSSVAQATAALVMSLLAVSAF